MLAIQPLDHHQRLDQGGLHIIAYAHTIACQERDRQHPVPQVENLGTL
jgi:hypothetical protein